MIPYAQFFVMLFASSYSRFWAASPFWFISLNGLYLTYVTAIFNLNSTGRMRFDYWYMEPLTYLCLVGMDRLSIKYTEMNTLLMCLYIAFAAVTFLKYILFMTSVVNQLCSFLGIRFIRVKDKAPAKVASKKDK